MAQSRYYMDTQNIVVDDVANTATFTLYAQDELDPPAGSTQGFIVASPSISMAAPVRKNTGVTNAVYVDYKPKTGGGMAYTRYEYVSGAWVNKGACNVDGSQPVR